MIKSDQISSFFKKSGPEITFLTNYYLFGQYDVTTKKNAPARNAPAGRATSEFG